jgi:hypothetical protein
VIFTSSSLEILYVMFNDLSVQGALFRTSLKGNMCLEVFSMVVSRTVGNRFGNESSLRPLHVNCLATTLNVYSSNH